MSDGMIKRLFETGAHFGYSRTRNHPSTKPFIFGYKNRQAIIDLEKTFASLRRAKDFIRGLGQRGATVLFVGTKDEAREPVTATAEALGQPYVVGRWLGGTFTNWPQMKSRIDRLADLKARRASGDLAVYTKKERLIIDKEIARLERYFASLKGLTQPPAAVVLVDPRQGRIAANEARALRIPVVSLAGTDCDIRSIDWPVIANDANVASIKLFLEEIASAYQEGRAAAVLPEVPTASGLEVRMPEPV